MKKSENICSEKHKKGVVHFIHKRVWILWITYAQLGKEKKIYEFVQKLKILFLILCEKSIDERTLGMLY